MNIQTEKRTGAFTLVELLVVIAIIALLAAIIVPTLGNVRAKAASTACLSNLRQLGIAFVGYANDYDDELPMEYRSGGAPAYDEGYGYGGRWYVRLADAGYLGAAERVNGGQVSLNGPGIIHCPAERGRGDSQDVWQIADYAPPTWLFLFAPQVDPVMSPPRLSAVKNPSSQVGLADTQYNTAFFNPGAKLDYGFWKMDAQKRHGNFRNFMFLDGHSERLLNSDILTNAATYFDPRD